MYFTVVFILYLFYQFWNSENQLEFFENSSSFFRLFGFSLEPITSKRKRLIQLQRQRILEEESARDDPRFRNLVRVTGSSNDSRFWRNRPTRINTIDSLSN